MPSQTLSRLLYLPGLIWLLGVLGVGLALLAAMSLGTTDGFGNPLYGLEPANYRDAVDPVYLPVVLRTIAYASATTLLCLVLGMPIAYLIAFHGGRRKTLLLLGLIVPFLVSYLVRSYALITLFADEGVINGLLGTQIEFLNTPAAVVGGLVNGFLVFMILPIYATLDRMDRSTLEAGMDLYATRLSTFWHVVWPASRPGVVAGCILVFTPAMGDYVAAQFFGGASTSMIGTIIQTQFREASNWPLGAALTVVMLAALALWLGVASRLAGTGSKT